MDTNKNFSIVLIILLVIIIVLLSMPLFSKKITADEKTLPPQITRFVDGNNICYMYRLNNGGGLKTFNEIDNDQIAISCINNN